MRELKVPEATVTRVSLYHRTLESLCRRNVTIVSSEDIARVAEVCPSQVRKDLSYFGEFGTRGLGYDVGALLNHTRNILGLNRSWAMIMVGAGKLAHALSTYQGFNEGSFNVVAVFDNDLTKTGKKLGHLQVYALERLPGIVAQYGVVIGVIAVPAHAAQQTAELLVENGLLAILNFAPVCLNLPKHIVLRNVDLSTEMEVLTFNLCHPLESLPG